MVFVVVGFGILNDKPVLCFFPIYFSFCSEMLELLSLWANIRLIFIHIPGLRGWLCSSPLTPHLGREATRWRRKPEKPGYSWILAKSLRNSLDFFTVFNDVESNRSWVIKWPPLLCRCVRVAVGIAIVTRFRGSPLVAGCSLCIFPFWMQTRMDIWFLFATQDTSVEAPTWGFSMSLYICDAPVIVLMFL